MQRVVGVINQLVIWWHRLSRLTVPGQTNASVFVLKPSQSWALPISWGALKKCVPVAQHNAKDGYHRKWCLSFVGSETIPDQSNIKGWSNVSFFKIPIESCRNFSHCPPSAAELYLGGKWLLLLLGVLGGVFKDSYKMVPCIRHKWMGSSNRGTPSYHPY